MRLNSDQISTLNISVQIIVDRLGLVGNGTNDRVRNPTTLGNQLRTVVVTMRAYNCLCKRISGVGSDSSILKQTTADSNNGKGVL